MRTALVGLGRFHFQQHAPAICKYMNEVAPLAILLCDLDPERTAAWQAQFGAARIFEDTSTLISQGKPDAAYITVQPEATSQTVGEFVRARIPVFTEKPPGISVAQCRELIEAAGDTPHAVGFNRRFSPVLRRAKELADDVLGSTPSFVGCSFLRSARYDPDFSTTVVHGIDAIRFLAGDIASVEIASVEHHEDRPYRDYTLAGTMESGALMEMTIRPVCGKAVERYVLSAENASLEARLAMPGLDDRGCILIHKGGTSRKIDEQALGIQGEPDVVRYGFYDQTRAFLDGLRHNRPIGPTFSDCLQSVAIMEQIRNAKSVGAHALRTRQNSLRHGQGNSWTDS